jgi:subtilisin family serine protease
MSMLKRIAPAVIALSSLPACGGSAGDDTVSPDTGIAAEAASPSADAFRSAADAVVEREILLKLKSSADLPPILQRHRLTLLQQMGPRPIYRVRMIDAGSLERRIAAVKRERGVLVAEPNRFTQAPEARKYTPWAIGEPDDYRAQWAPQALRLPTAHTVSQGAGQTVAVLDTGVDASHPALAGALVPGRDWIDGDLDPAEVFAPDSGAWGHGTHVAGIVRLIAPQARIMPVRVLNAQGAGDVWTIGQALLWSVDPDGVPATPDGARVVNMSLGTVTPTRMLDVFVEIATCSDDDDDEDDDDFGDPGYAGDQERCNLHGGAVVAAAAGNGASATERQYPAAEAAEGSLAVAASTSASTIASFSNRGPWIPIAAPGEGITSTVPGGTYAVWSGTSMAAPMIAGVSALLRAAQPDWKPVDVTKRILDRSRTICGTSIRAVDAGAALVDETPPPTPC